MRLDPSRTLRFHRHHLEDWLSWGLRATIVVMLGAAALRPDWQPFDRAVQGLVLLLGLMLATITPMLPARWPRFMRGVEAAVSSLFVLHGAGHLVGWYDWIHYDTLVHGYGGLVGALAGYWLARATHLFWDVGDVRPFRAFWVALSVSVVAGSLVEAVEFASDAAFGTQSQGTAGQDPLLDTMFDLYAELVMGLVAATIVAWWTRRQGHHSQMR